MLPEDGRETDELLESLITFTYKVRTVEIAAATCVDTLHNSLVTQTSGVGQHLGDSSEDVICLRYQEAQLKANLPESKVQNRELEREQHGCASFRELTQDVQ